MKIPVAGVMLKKNVYIILILLLAVLLIVLVIWVFGRRIERIERKGKTNSYLLRAL